jgi:phosphatidylinositol glycan class F
MASANSPSAMNPPSSSSQAPAEKPSAPPVNILPSQLAQGYSYVHPVLLLALCAFRFDALVADPVQELLRDLPWLALLQMFYVMLCLPPARSQASEAGSDSEEKKKTAPRSPPSPAVTLRPGKPGYRRKQQTGKHDWAGVWAKLMVRVSRSSSCFNAIANTVL